MQTSIAIVHTIKQNSSLCRFVKPAQKFGDSALSAPRFAGQRDAFPVSDAQIEVGENATSFLVRELDIFKAHFADLHGVSVWSQFRLRRDPLTFDGARDFRRIPDLGFGVEKTLQTFGRY